MISVYDPDGNVVGEAEVVDHLVRVEISDARTLQAVEFGLIDNRHFSLGTGVNGLPAVHLLTNVRR